MHILYIVMTETEKKITINLYTDTNKNIIFFNINDNNDDDERYAGTLIGPNLTDGKNGFTDKLKLFFENNSDFSDFLKIYQKNTHPTHSRSWMSSIFNHPPSDTHPDPSSTPRTSISNDLPSPKPNNTKGGKKTKSNRSYNANKTLKNRK